MYVEDESIIQYDGLNLVRQDTFEDLFVLVNHQTPYQWRSSYDIVHYSDNQSPEYMSIENRQHLVNNRMVLDKWRTTMDVMNAMSMKHSND